MITIEVQGEKQLDIALRGAAKDLSDFRLVALAVSDEIYSIVREQFATEGGRAGRRWPKRTTAYLDSITRTNRKGFKSLGLPLRSSDALFTAVTTRNAPGGIYDATEEGLTLGTNLKSERGYPYPIAHQEGRGNNPVRRIYDLTDEDGKRIGRIITKALKGPIQDRGFDYTEDSGEIPF